MTPSELVKQALAADRALRIGDPVIVRWGYGLGFRASGRGVVVSIFPHSLRVRLTEAVSSSRGHTWPAGFVFMQIPRFGTARWQHGLCATPILNTEAV